MLQDPFLDHPVQESLDAPVVVADRDRGVLLLEFEHEQADTGYGQLLGFANALAGAIIDKGAYLVLIVGQGPGRQAVHLTGQEEPLKVACEVVATSQMV